MSSNPSLPQEEQSSSTPKTTGGAEDANDDDEEKILNDKKKIGSSWAYLLAAAAAISIYHHEKKRQDELTAPPLVYTQDTKWMNALRSILSRSNITNKTDTDDSNSTHLNHLNHSEEGILTRDYKPSLVVGTRSTLSSAFAYGASGPKHIPSRLQVREILSIETDGAKLALDWELPSMASSTKITTLTSTKSTTTTTTSALSEEEKQEQRNMVLHGPIDKPVVLLLHGINNDASFGYMRSLMRTCTDRGWIACGMNFRGCGGIHLHTPRSYNASETIDIRTVVQKIAKRLKDDTVPLFLVGSSLGANIMTKYLGEEGYSGTLLKCIKGAVTLANPINIHGSNCPFPWGNLLAAGVKKTLLHNWRGFKEACQCSNFKHAFIQILTSKNIGELDDAAAPVLLYNDTVHPYGIKLGYKDGRDYWNDASSSRYISHVPIPLLSLSSDDDFLVTKPARRSLRQCLNNPNVMVVNTKCGGHLGWQEAGNNRDRSVSIMNFLSGGGSWADTAMADFFSAVMELEQGGHGHERNDTSGATSGSDTYHHNTISNNSTEERSVTSSLRVPLHPPSLPLRSKL